MGAGFSDTKVFGTGKNLYMPRPEPELASSDRQAMIAFDTK
jgi:hypothetical protein